MATSYWCMPCAADAERYSQVIKVIAAAQGAPVFEPHLTLATLDHESIDIGGAIRALRGLSLEPMDIDGTDAFTTSLFVRFQPSAPICAARGLMERMPGFRPGRSFDPHVSLCYGAPPERSRLSLRVAALLGRPVRFDRLAAVTVSATVETYADVAAFTQAESYPI